MVFNINPGAQIPHLVKGDICVIQGNEYPYLGEVGSKVEIPLTCIGVFKIKLTGQYYLRHKKDQVIEREYTNQIVSAVLNDTAPITRERVNKEIFNVPICQGDNYLKVLLKQILNSMKIDLRDYKDRFGNDNRMNNMRRLITGPANLTYEKFLEWLEILEYSHGISIYKPDGSIFNYEEHQ